MRKEVLFIIFIIASIYPMISSAQEVVLKSNLLYWSTGTPNIGIELAAGKKYSINISGGYMPFEYSENKKLKHWVIQPELRYWPCETFNGHFFGIHALGGQFNSGGIKMPFNIFPSLEKNRYQGWGAGAGISYGYHLMLSRRWSLEFSLGLGYAYLKYKKYKCVQCGGPQKEDHTNYLGPTKLAINLIYVL